jgi:predicted esterase
VSRIGEVIGQFGDLYGAGSYADALALVINELPQHPYYEAMLLCYSAAMSARLGDTSSAIATFRAALDKGYWYHEGALRGDPDFTSLQAETKFQALVEQCAQRRQVALATVKPVLRVLEPATATSQTAPLLIAVHGGISNVDHDAAYWQPAVEQGWRVALPQSTGLSWVSGLYNWNAMDVALAELDQHYQTLMSQYAIDPADIVLAGFSQGGLVAEQAVLTKRIPARGLLFIEGARDENIAQLIAEHQPYDLRAYFAAGTGQDFIATAELMAQAMREVGIVCEIERMPNRHHDYPASFPQTIARALKFLCP